MKKDQQVRLDKSRKVPRIEISGDFSDALEADLRAIYHEACQSEPRHILIQFDAAGDIYSSGIAVLIGLIGEAQSRGQQLFACGLSEHFAEVFALTGITRYIQIFPSAQEAFAHFV